MDIYTTAAGPLSAKPTETLFGEVRKTCAFITRTLRVPTQHVATTAVGITREQIATADLFKATLTTFIRRRMEDVREGFAVAPLLQFHPEHRTFQKSVFWYRSPTDNLIQLLLNEIGESLNIRCAAKFVRGSTKSQQAFQLDSVSWQPIVA